MGERQPSSPAKFALGLLFLAFGIAIMVPAALLCAQGKVSPDVFDYRLLCRNPGRALSQPHWFIYGNQARTGDASRACSWAAGLSLTVLVIFLPDN